jgi:hypothetical protein
LFAELRNLPHFYDMPRDNQTARRSSLIDAVKHKTGRLHAWYLSAAKYRKIWVSGSGMLWPTAMTLFAFVLIQNVGQLHSLGSALAASMRGHYEYYDGGFAASIGDVLIWWASCWLVILACATYGAEKEDVNAPEATSRYRWGQGGLTVYILSNLLVLSPLVAGGLDAWRPDVLLSLATMSLLAVWGARLGLYYFVSLVLCVVVAIVSIQAERWGVAAGVMGAWGLFVRFHPRWSKSSCLALGAMAVATITGDVAVFGTIFANSMLAHQDPQHYSWDSRILLLAAWWLAPALLVLSAGFVRSRFADRTLNVMATVLVLVIFAFVANQPASMFGLNTLCLFLASLLSVANLIRTSRVGLIRRIVIYPYLVAAVFSVKNIAPIPDFSKYQAPISTGASNPSSFFGYYVKWLKARGETPHDHGPLVFVAVAGGGIRAAAHASVALSLADDKTGGKFGERTLMISAVSGGALGTATWLAQRVDGLPPADPARIRSGGASPRALALSRFYRNDFLSPVVNRMLLHDLPLAASLMSNGKSDRDAVLQEAWQTSWENLLRENKILRKDGSLFRRKVGALSSDGVLPLVVLNATSAADGRSAAYASHPGAVRWAWQLDQQVPLGRAVLDSARFAGVSPVGVACAQEGAFDIPRMVGNTLDCKPGFRPLAIADGGYRDNSGLAEIAVAIDELARNGDPLDQVYVVQIRSNPEEGIRQLEGTRFDSGKLLPEVLAPAIVQESARGGHSEAYEQQIMGHSNRVHMMIWGISHKVEAESLALQQQEQHWRFAWLDKRAREANLERQLRLPPLGWTIDPESYWALYRDSLIVPDMPVTGGGCDSMLPQYTSLCKALVKANSVVAHPVNGI